MRGLVLAFTVLALMLSLLVFVGEGVRDAFDPRRIFGAEASPPEATEWEEA